MEPVVPPTGPALEHKKRLYILMAVHAVLSIMIMFFISFMNGLTELISVLILWCATAQMHFCMLIFYMLMCLVSFTQYFAGIGLQVQTG